MPPALRLAALALLVAELGLPGRGAADPPARATGDWGGLRTRLSERGVDLFADYTGTLWANVRGGREEEARYEGFVAFGAVADLTALLGWPGAALRVDGFGVHADRPTDDLVGASATHFVSGWEARRAARVYRIQLEQELLDGDLRVKLGQLAADDDFGISRHSALFLNAVFGDFLRAEAPLEGPVFPLAAPGIYAEYAPAEAWAARLGAYTADVGRDELDNFGFDWSFDADAGAAFSGELAARPRLLGRPGAYTVGVAATTGERTDFRSGERERGSLALYAMIDQTLWADARGEPRLGFFARGAATPRADRAVMRWHLDAGLVLHDPIPGRAGRGDALGAAFSVLEFGDAFVDARRAAGADVARTEIVVEVTARLALAPWLHAQPDLQILLGPQLSRRDAVVLGLRFELRL